MLLFEVMKLYTFVVRCGHVAVLLYVILCDWCAMFRCYVLCSELTKYIMIKVCKNVLSLEFAFEYDRLCLPAYTQVLKSDQKCWQ